MSNDTDTVHATLRHAATAIQYNTIQPYYSTVMDNGGVINIKFLRKVKSSYMT